LAKGFIEPGEKPLRFYKDVETAQAEGGFAILLDGRAVKTPKGLRLVLPTEALAELVAEEWAGQGERIELAAMHALRLANTAAESVPRSREATAEQIARYAASDLVCYFAEEPAGLVERQEQHWAPLLVRAEQDLALPFVRAAGIVHQEQPQATLGRVKALALGLDDFGLAGLAFGAALFGSTVLAFALQHGWLSGEQAYELSRLDEAWQEEKWGVDAEAAERTQRLFAEARMLERWFKALAR
jgi:chaperone required for assembly of F1-ATPase